MITQTKQPLTVESFWNQYEDELVISITKNPEQYMPRPGLTIAENAAVVRRNLQATAEAHSISRINLDSPTFRRLAKRLGIEKFSQGRLKEVYACYGGK